MKITVLYDNEALKNGLLSAHGFSALLEDENFNVLFDTGWSGPILLYNVEKLKKKLDNVRFVFLSHQHWDHIGGLPDVLEGLKKNVNFVIPSSFTSGFKRELSRYGKIIEVKDKVFEFAPGFYSTGEMDSDAGIKEHALFVKGKKSVLLVGCSHPDVYRMVKKIGSVDILIGGFHWFKEIELLDYVVKEAIFPCHCTVMKEEIVKMYPTKSKKCGVGLEVVL